MLAWALTFTAAQARVAHVEIVSCEAVANGAAFGAVGAYELVTARVDIAEDPATARNAAVVDLALTSRDRAGLLHASADLVVL